MAQKTMYPAAVNSRQTELSAAITSAQTTITVLDISVIPAAPNLLSIGTDETAETILYTGVSGNNLTGVTRGFQGTAKAWTAGTKLARYYTAYDHDTVRENLADLDTRVNAAETPAGAQAKADAAKTSANTYTDTKIAAIPPVKDASTAQKGVVQLIDSTTSTSTTLAPTANAVKLAMDQANSAFQSASNGKNSIASAITGKGVPATGSDDFATLASKIGQISIGKKYASGNIGNLSAGTSININSLTFFPSIVIVKFTIAPTNFTFFVTRSGTVLYPGNNASGAYTGVDTSSNMGSVISTTYGSISNYYFTLGMYNDYARTGISWYAYE